MQLNKLEKSWCPTEVSSLISIHTQETCFNLPALLSGFDRIQNHTGKWFWCCIMPEAHGGMLMGQPVHPGLLQSFSLTGVADILLHGGCKPRSILAAQQNELDPCRVPVCLALKLYEVQEAWYYSRKSCWEFQLSAVVPETHRSYKPPPCQGILPGLHFFILSVHKLWAFMICPWATTNATTSFLCAAQKPTRGIGCWILILFMLSEGLLHLLSFL